MSKDKGYKLRDEGLKLVEKGDKLGLSRFKKEA